MLKNNSKKHINLAEIYEKGEDLIEKIPIVKKRRERRKISNNLKYFSYGFLAIFLFFILFTSIYLLSFKRAYSLAIEGKNNLEAAVQQVGSQDFGEAALLSREAQKNFNLANLHLEKIKDGFISSNFKYANKQINNLEYLIKTAEVLSRVAEHGSQFGQEIIKLSSQDKSFSFSEFSKEEKRDILKLLYESGPELNGMKANIDLAYLNLKQVEGGALFFPIKSKLESLESDLYEASLLIEKAIPFTEMIPVLAGYPDKSTFLIMLQNSDELRPTGGFLGTYGLLEIENGDITKLDTHDIYHMDMPVNTLINVDPPAPIKKYLVEKWYMRDANWSPDWPTSAEKIEWFYHKENNLLPTKDQINNFSGEFDGVIGITPDLVVSLLELVGPIEIEGQIYNPENFTELLEYRVEQGYSKLGVPKWERKEVIGEIAKELKARLFNLSLSKWKEVIYLMNDNIYRKNILVYLKNDQLENLSKEFGWSGEIKKVLGDYLMVVDANLAAAKTDAVMSKSVDYKLEQSNKGLIAKLRINYAHNGNFDWRTTRYQSYTRVYVPRGSTLIKTEGFKSEIIDIENEFDKTYFGGFFIVEPGDRGSIYIEYRLPKELNDLVESGKYELYIQKQPGNKTRELSIDLSMENDIKSYWPVSFFADKKTSSNVSWRTDLATDKKFELEF